MALAVSSCCKSRWLLCMDTASMLQAEVRAVLAVHICVRSIFHRTLPRLQLQLQRSLKVLRQNKWVFI